MSVSAGATSGNACRATVAVGPTIRVTLRHLDEQKRVLGVGLAILVGHRTTTEDLDVGLGLVREHHRHLDRYDRSADQTDGQQLGQVVDERSVPSAV
jgi:hypothetical protein